MYSDSYGGSEREREYREKMNSHCAIETSQFQSCSSEENFITGIGTGVSLTTTNCLYKKQSQSRLRISKLHKESWQSLL